MDFDLTSTLANLPIFFQGAMVTIAVSLPGALLGILVGLVLTAAKRSSFLPIKWIGSIYISFIRGTPLLVQIFFVYYALPGLIGINVSAFYAGILALGLNSGAFVTEILRAGLSGIPRGQWDASDALGINRLTAWRKVILPQLIVRIIPPLTNEFTMLVKASPLLSVITVVELTRTAQHVMNETYRPIEAFIVAAIIYFIMLSALSYATRRVERWSEESRA